MITRDLGCPWHDHCIICSYDVTGADFENLLYAFGQSEKRWRAQCIIKKYNGYNLLCQWGPEPRQKSICSSDYNYPKSFIKLVSGTAMIFTLGKRNISRPFWKMFTLLDHVKNTGHNIKWDHFDILASGKTDYYCKVKETFFIQDLQPAIKCQYQQWKAVILFSTCFQLLI